MEYTVIEDFELEQLIKHVNEHIKEGWKPLGGVVVSQGGVVDKYIQAMIILNE